MHVIAAKAVTSLSPAPTPTGSGWSAPSRRPDDRAALVAAEARTGATVVTGGTDVHQLLVDLGGGGASAAGEASNHASGATRAVGAGGEAVPASSSWSERESAPRTGREAWTELHRLNEIGISANAIRLAYDALPEPGASGLRFGTTALASRASASQSSPRSARSWPRRSRWTTPPGLGRRPPRCAERVRALTEAHRSMTTSSKRVGLRPLIRSARAHRSSRRDGSILEARWPTACRRRGRTDRACRAESVAARRPPDGAGARSEFGGASTGTATRPLWSGRSPPRGGTDRHGRLRDSARRAIHDATRAASSTRTRRYCRRSGWRAVEEALEAGANETAAPCTWPASRSTTVRSWPRSGSRSCPRTAGRIARADQGRGAAPLPGDDPSRALRDRSRTPGGPADDEGAPVGLRQDRTRRVCPAFASSGLS